MSNPGKNTLKTGMPLPYDLVLTRGRIRFRKGTLITSEILKMIKGGSILEIKIDSPRQELSQKNREIEPETSSHAGDLLKKTLILRNARNSLNEITGNNLNPLAEVQAQLERMWSDTFKPVDISIIHNAIQKWTDTLAGGSNHIATIGWTNTSEHFLPSHMTNVSKLVSLVGIEMEMSSESLREIALAGLFLDVGEMFLSREILLKTGEFELSELSKIREHPRKSVEFLKRNNFNSEVTHRLILRHHERHDGSGYPYNITGKVLGYDDCLLGLADVFVALISHRPHRPALTRRAALRQILAMRGNKFSEDHVQRFVKILGLYPPGSIVQLKGGAVAIVLSTVQNGKWNALLISQEPGSKTTQEIDLNHLSGDYIVHELA